MPFSLNFITQLYTYCLTAKVFHVFTYNYFYFFVKFSAIECFILIILYSKNFLNNLSTVKRNHLALTLMMEVIYMAEAANESVLLEAARVNCFDARDGANDD